MLRFQNSLTSLTTKVAILILSLGMVVFLGSESHAYYSVINNGELLAPGQFQAGFEPQYIFNRYSGLEAIGRFDAGINEASNVRGFIGIGPVNFEIGGFYKWIPFPDTATQPAIGGELGGSVAQISAGTVYNLRFDPLVSKRFETEVGDLIPYASLPLGITSRPDKTVLPVQLVIGSEFRPLNHKNLSFFGELGTDVNEAVGYLSVAIAFRFDDNSVHHHSAPKRPKSNM